MIIDGKEAEVEVLKRNASLANFRLTQEAIG